MNNQIYKKMLANASEIQYWMNVVKDCDGVYCRSGIWYAFFDIGHGISYEWSIPTKIAKFIIKGRQLKSGLKSPMARYYGYKYLTRRGWS